MSHQVNGKFQHFCPTTTIQEEVYVMHFHRKALTFSSKLQKWGSNLGSQNYHQKKTHKGKKTFNWTYNVQSWLANNQGKENSRQREQHEQKAWQLEMWCPCLLQSNNVQLGPTYLLHCLFISPFLQKPVLRKGLY